MGWGRYAIGLIAALCSGCTALPAFTCADDAECLDAGVQGTCEAVGICSFPDDSCVSGDRYGEYGASVLAGQCVGEDDDVASSTGAGGDSTVPDSGGGSETSPPDPTTDPTTDPTDPTGASTSTTSPASGSDASSSGDDSGSTGEPGGTTDPGPTVLSFGEGDDAIIDRVTDDTYIDSKDPDQTHGSHEDMHIMEMEYVGLLSFEVDAIPAGARVVDAQLRVHTGDSPSISDSYKFFEVMESWSADSVDQQPGVANWTYRNTGDPWTTPGAGTGSRDSTILAQIDDPTTDTEYVLEIDPVVVQGWVDDPDSNHGFAIVGLGSIGPYGWLMSSEAPSSQRPMLTVSYYE